MANFRQIHVSIWKDSWFCELSPDEKLLFIYLFSNESTSLSGIYKITKKFISFETGINRKRVDEILVKFEADNKVFYEGDTVWVVNMPKYHATKSAKVQKRIYEDFLLIPDSEIKNKYIGYYRLNIPYRYPIDTSPQLKENENEDEKENERNDNFLLPPFIPQVSGVDYAVRVFCKVTDMVAIPGGDIDKVLPAMAAIRTRYKDDESMINYLQPFWEAWKKLKGKNGRSYSKTNCAWLYQYAVSGEIPGQTTATHEESSRGYTHA